MRYTASAETLAHITALVFQVRPGWDSSLVRIVLQSHADLVDGNDLAIAALRAAQDDRLPSPKAIGWRGPHWDGLDTKPTEVRDLYWCQVCMRPEPECYSIRFADDDHPFEPGPRPQRRRR